MVKKKFVPELLIPCPFCGGSNLNQTELWVKCLDCKTYGPITQHWNNRASLIGWVATHAHLINKTKPNNQSGKDEK